MSSGYNSRSHEEVARISTQRTEVRYDDIPSDDEENFSEAHSCTESEQDASEIDENDDDDLVVEPEEHSDAPPSPKRSKSDTASTRGGRKTTRATAPPSASTGGTRGRRGSSISGTNGHRWFTAPRERTTTGTPDASYVPGPVGTAKKVTSAYEAWSLFIDDAVVAKIVGHTDEEIDRYARGRKINRSTDPLYKLVDPIEFKAFLGLLYFSGLQKTNATPLDDLWNAKYGSIVYRAAMSLKRFNIILRFLRYDDKATRPARLANDNFAPVREIWENFVEKCKTLYNPASYCTVDEQVLSFRGRCPFKVYSESKPDKYGIKIVMLNDSTTFYMFNAIPYAGKPDTERSEEAPSYYVRKLSEPSRGTIRNITCDNWFSSIEIFDNMLDRDITMVGTLRKNKTEIPPTFKNPGEPGSSKFAFDATKTLVSFASRQDKLVLVLSTFHRFQEISKSTGEPEMLVFYNSTKGGTETFDRLCREYTTARKTRRWPMRVFAGMLDQAAINSLVVYNSNSRNEALDGRSFLKNLVESLVVPHLKRRLATTTMPRHVVWCIQQILQEPALPKPTKETTKPGRCVLCPRTTDKKFSIRCHRCKSAMCQEHRHLLCEICVQRDV